MNTLDTKRPPILWLLWNGRSNSTLPWTGCTPTHQCGSQAINGIFITPRLLGHPSGYLSGLAVMRGNHHGLWVDLPEQWLLGGPCCQLPGQGPTGLNLMTLHPSALPCLNIWKRFLMNIFCFTKPNKLKWIYQPKAYSHTTKKNWNDLMTYGYRACYRQNANTTNYTHDPMAGHLSSLD